MREPAVRPLRLPATVFLISSLTFLVSTPAMHGQTPEPPAPNAPPGISDPGPRNPGSTQSAFCPTSKVGVTVKFPSSNMGPNAPAGTDCVDIIQPGSPAGQPHADGAGNIVGGYPAGAASNTLGGLWIPGLDTFSTVASVIGGASSEPMVGLGPSFNSQSCFQCHMVPAVGGTSPGIVSIVTSAASTAATTFAMPINGTPPPATTSNPEITAGEDDGATNQTPDFNAAFALPGVTTPGFPTVEVEGPVIEVRFHAALAANGDIAGVGANGVGNLWTIQGRGDLPSGCAISQIKFNKLANGAISFRIPTPTFGLGFVESTPDPILIQNAANSAAAAGSSSLINFGVFNTSGNDGSITRFGWKAQNKSLLIFAGEAENVEMGVTNELFPNERTWGATSTGTTLTVPPCIDNAVGYPEDELLATGTQNLATVSSNFELDSIFMLLNGAPSQCSSAGAGTYGSATPVCKAFDANEQAGQTAFTTAGCNLCHSPSLVTGPSPNVSLSSQAYAPYSDFALHGMGGLDDGIVQGAARADQFRTAPLWGLGQRLFFMHDGRDTNLINAIEDHCIATTSTTISASEACAAVSNFNGTGPSPLNPTQQQQLLDFLRSL